MPFCVKCGERLDKDQVFCPNCGEANAAPVNTQSTPAVEEDSAKSENMINLDNPKPRKKKKGIIITLAAVLVIAIAAVVCIYAMGGFMKPYEKLTYMVNTGFDALETKAQNINSKNQRIIQSTDCKLTMNLDEIPPSEITTEIFSTAAVDFSYKLDKDNNRIMLDSAASLSGMELISAFLTLDSTGIGAYNEDQGKYVVVPWETLTNEVTTGGVPVQSAATLTKDDIEPALESLNKAVLTLINENTVTLEKKSEVLMKNGASYVCDKYVTVPTETEWSAFLAKLYDISAEYNDKAVQDESADVESSIAELAKTLSDGGTTISIYVSGKKIVRFNATGNFEDTGMLNCSCDLDASKAEGYIWAEYSVGDTNAAGMELVYKSEGGSLKLNGQFDMQTQTDTLNVDFSCELSETAFSGIGVNYGTYNCDISGSLLEEAISFTLDVGAGLTGGSSHVLTLDKCYVLDVDLSGAKIMLATTDEESAITWPNQEPVIGTTEDLTGVLSMGVNPLLAMLLG